MKSQIDSLLFGENFQEKYKAAKEVKRTALDLKAGPSGNKQEKKNRLNYKRQSNRPRFKTETGGRGRDNQSGRRRSSHSGLGASSPTKSSVGRGNTTTRGRAIRFGNVLPWLQGGYQGILYEERPTRRLHIHHVSFDK
ncbi:uncharacterized protein LOC126749530 isoform X1 [Anthonomus grandis grandis]|uniref:uncharacterized protein LOC126749530 isoform X1 n=1 Tax=Anthonomus grandis grandis TaxID=2921223 RepID=UPI0021665D4D|nr:uncharacterized protein LOC126749530 isoform X1 [Anthonomus grandis grandis]